MAVKKQKANPNDFVSYLRVSTGEQAESGLGLEAQRATIGRECNSRGWNLIQEFVDAGVSGAIEVKKRPNLVEALDFIKNGKASVLIMPSSTVFQEQHLRLAS